MTTKRRNFSLVSLPPGEGGLIAIGGYNGNFIDVVECFDCEGATEWRRLAPLPLPLASRGGGRAHFLLNDKATLIVYRFSPTRQAYLEEKRVSVKDTLKQIYYSLEHCST